MKYTKKVSGLIYEPTGVCPFIFELTNKNKKNELIKEIKSQELPDEVEDFLIEAAHRHTVFNYAKIAEYYCHAPANVQRLMEKSALVVIDIDDAIENGLVVFSKKLEELRNGKKDDEAVTLDKEVKVTPRGETIPLW